MTGINTAVSSDQVIVASDGRPRLQGKGPGLFAIVSDHCGHCHSLKRSVADAQKTGEMNFYYMSGDDEDPETRRVMKELKVSGFPDMYEVQKDGAMTPYLGDRKPSALLSNFGSSKFGSSKLTATSSQCPNARTWHGYPMFYAVLVVIAALLLLGFGLGSIFRPKTARF